MICNSCGTELIEGSHFCTKCGKPIINIVECQNCGELVDNYFKFCPKCGAELSARLETKEKEYKASNKGNNKYKYSEQKYKITEDYEELIELIEKPLDEDDIYEIMKRLKYGSLVYFGIDNIKYALNIYENEHYLGLKDNCNEYLKKYDVIYHKRSTNRGCLLIALCAFVLIVFLACSGIVNTALNMVSIFTIFGFLLFALLNKVSALDDYNIGVLLHQISLRYKYVSAIEKDLLSLDDNSFTCYGDTNVKDLDNGKQFDNSKLDRTTEVKDILDKLPNIAENAKKIATLYVDDANYKAQVINNLIPEKYLNGEDLDSLYNIFDSRRAKTITDAMNILVSDKREEEQAELERQRIAEEESRNRIMESIAREQLASQERMERDAHSVENQRRSKEKYNQNQFNYAKQQYEKESRLVSMYKNGGNYSEANKAKARQDAAYANMMKYKN